MSNRPYKIVITKDDACETIIWGNIVKSFGDFKLSFVERFPQCNSADIKFTWIGESAFCVVVFIFFCNHIDNDSIYTNTITICV